MSGLVTAGPDWVALRAPRPPSAPALDYPDEGDFARLRRLASAYDSAAGVAGAGAGAVIRDLDVARNLCAKPRFNFEVSAQRLARLSLLCTALLRPLLSPPLPPSPAAVHSRPQGAPGKELPPRHARGRKMPRQAVRARESVRRDRGDCADARCAKTQTIATPAPSSHLFTASQDARGGHALPAAVCCLSEVPGRRGRGARDGVRARAHGFRRLHRGLLMCLKGSDILMKAGSRGGGILAAVGPASPLAA